jgi:hypothetical protein
LFAVIASVIRHEKGRADTFGDTVIPARDRHIHNFPPSRCHGSLLWSSKAITLTKSTDYRNTNMPVLFHVSSNMPVLSLAFRLSFPLLSLAFPPINQTIPEFTRAAA